MSGIGRRWVVGALAAAPLLRGAAARAQHRRVVEGARQMLGEGTAHAWVGLDEAERPVALGVTLSEDALRGLPGQMLDLTLDLPAPARQAGFDHVGLNWEPHGHEPPGVYDVPHFDVHFYAITPADRDRIGPDDPAYATKLEAVPAAAQRPENYMKAPGGVPRMGAHWVAGDAAELNGQRFERTFLFGTYEGRLIFVEPMVTRDFLQTRPDVTLPVRAPEQAAPFAWPRAYTVAFDPAERVYRIAIIGLLPR